MDPQASSQKPKAKSQKPKAFPKAPSWRIGLLVPSLFCSLGCMFLQVEERELSPAEVLALREKGIDFSKTKYKDQKPTIEALVDFGNLKANFGNFEQARNLLNQALEQDEKYVPAHVGLAKMYIMQKNPAMALEILEKAKRYGPRSPEIYNEISVALAQMEDYVGAIVAAEKALQLDPNNKLYETNLATMLVGAGDQERSFALFSRSLSPADAHLRIAGILYGQHDLSACLSQLHKALEADPGHEKAATFLEQLTANSVKQASYLGVDSRDGVK